MELVNRTRAVAYLYSVNLLEPERRAAVIVKMTYALGADGALVPADDPLGLIPDQLVTEFGQFHGEIFFRKRGADVCVLGTARLPSPVERARVRLEVGAWAHELDLVGDRVWTRDASGALVPSAPAPFREMPVAYQRAFGGVSEANGEDVPWMENPGGRGYYQTSDQALGQPLPNVIPTQVPAPLSWDTRLPVVGWGPYPNYWALRATRAVKVDPGTGAILDVTPELFNHAHPDLIVESIAPGTPVRVVGLRASPLALVVPRPRPRVRVQVGAVVTEVFGEIDGLFIWVDEARVVVTWRARFGYPVREEELRSAELTFVE